jgi:hypothetical protein
MPVNPADLDHLLAHRGGFDTAYSKLVLFAQAKLLLYRGNVAGRAAVRQLDAEEVVNDAFVRLFKEGFVPGEDVYFLLRRHIANQIRTLAKSVQEENTVRVAADPELGELYEQQSDLNELSAPDRSIILDDVRYCLDVMQRVAAATPNDPEVVKLAEAFVAGYRDPGEICLLTDMTRAKYDAAFKRLQRKFLQANVASEERKP